MKKYPDELREYAIQLMLDAHKSDSGGKGTLTQIARLVGVSPETLRGWVIQHEVDTGQRVDTRKKTRPQTDLIPSKTAVKLFQELDLLFSQTAQEICQTDIETQAITECGTRETLIRRLAVVVKAGEIIKLMENMLFAGAVADPHISQADIGAALGITQQAVSYRKTQLPKPAPTDETSETSP